MSFSRRLRIRLIGILSMALLFSQIAVAAYACPAMGERTDGGVAAMAGMPCAEMMASGVQLDPEQPTLCMQHCQFGSTTHVVDHVSPVLAPVTSLPAVLEVSHVQGLETTLTARAEVERLRDRSPSIAQSIAHCCFRI